MDCKACGLPIDEHVEGRKLDACVAEAVMGLEHRKDIKGKWFWWDGTFRMNCPLYSTSIGDAWDVVEKLVEYGEHGCIIEIETTVAGWRAGVVIRRVKLIRFESRTFECAFCLAALEALSL